MLKKADGLYSNPIRDNSPCKGCQDRHTSCHDSCEKYVAWKQEIYRVNAERRKYNELPRKKNY